MTLQQAFPKNTSKMKEYKYIINGNKFTVGVGDMHDNTIEVEVNGTPYTVEMEQTKVSAVSKISSPKAPAAAPRTESGEKVISKPAPAATGNGTPVKSPLPGTIMSFKVKEGDTVAPGDTVCILEAMKMENDIHAQVGGTVKKILAGVGDAVLEGSDIMIIG